METEEEESSPFWVESSRRRHRGRRLTHGVSSFFLSSGLLVTLLLLTAIAFLGFVIPSTISLSSQFFRPNNVKKSWDSINLILVLFALIFGFLSRNKNQDRNVNVNVNEDENGAQVSNPSTPRGWYGGGGHGGSPAATGNGGGSGLRRSINSSSYPDLLEASPKLNSGVDSWGSYDDMRVYSSRFSGEGMHRRRSWKYAFDGGDDTQMPEIEDPFEDTFMGSPDKPPPVAHPSPPPPAPPSPPPAVTAPPPEYKRERRRKRSDPQIIVQETISEPDVTPVAPPSPPPPVQGTKRERRRRKRMDNLLVQREPISEPVVTPPPPPPEPLAEQHVNREKGKSEKKRSGGNATKDFLNSLYPKKKKKQRQKSVENFDALFHQPQIPPLHYQLPPPSPPPPAPPPPPPPPPSVFHNLFSSKKSRRKSTGTVISVPIPPPQPFSKPKTAQIPTSATYAGAESSLRRTPPPPPPPPPPPFLKSPAWRFVVQGDFVRVDSSVSSRSGSPEPDEEMESNGTPTASDGGDTTPFPASPLHFPPSPDVNSKADNFINRFRAGLKLEKMNSMNNRGVGRSNLGPG